MAVRVSDKVHTPKSTGLVDTPTDPVTSTQTVDNTSTDAVTMPDVVETSVDHYGADAVVRVGTPTEPVTMTLGWIADNNAAATEVPVTEQPQPEAKVIQPPAKRAPRKSAAKVQTKSK